MLITLATAPPATQHNIPGDVNLQQFRCDKLKYRSLCLLITVPFQL